ncbi:hypothetical protein GCM10023189_09660 [Nibrella saemangeumensis]|uniref:Lipocalin-like domain-containing protein n=1 Tax=Nibrella saemangeumensis TaxID=1084526 RepID=A0ABP8MFN1_9BACT
MKNLFGLRSFIMTMLVLSVAVVGCKKDNTEIDPTPSKSSVEGTWKMTGMKVNPAIDLGTGQTFTDIMDLLKLIPEGEQAVACLKDTKITFQKSGKVTAAASPACQSDEDTGMGVEDNSSWKVQGDKIILTDSDGPSEYDLSVSGSTMKWSQVADEDWDGDGKNTRYTYTLEFRRQ